MQSNNGKKSKRKPANPARYAVRFEGTDGIEQLGELTTNLEMAVTRAIRHHERYGCKIWVFSLRTGKTEYRLECEERTATGGAI
jgi:hypothetical protein